MRPTRIREKEMVITRSGKTPKFYNASSAIMSLQSIETYYAYKGLRIHSTIDVEAGICELAVYWSYGNPPTLPPSYLYTSKVTVINTIWLDNAKKPYTYHRTSYTFNF